MPNPPPEGDGLSDYCYYPDTQITGEPLNYCKPFLGRHKGKVLRYMFPAPSGGRMSRSDRKGAVFD